MMLPQDFHAHITRAIFLAPPVSLDPERKDRVFGNRPGVTRYPDGLIETTPRRDGTVTMISREYWEDYRTADLQSLYDGFTKAVPTFVVFAKDDEIIAADAYGSVSPYLKMQKVIPGNHDFSGAYRPEMIRVVREIFEIEIL